VTTFSAAIFDFGDTLFYSPSGADVLVEAGLDRARADRLWDHIWAQSKTAEELARGRDLGEEHHRKAWLDLFAPAESHVPGTAQLLYERVMDHDSWLPYPDTSPVLAALHDRGVRVGVLSNIPSSLRRVFEMHGLAGYVDAYTESYRHGRVKPDPELFRIACRDLDGDPGHTLMVGDSHVADGAATAVGMTALILPPVPRGSERGLECALTLCCAARSSRPR
jgi:HAD superfamily hydrolase (TIGR01509 family)